MCGLHISLCCARVGVYERCVCGTRVGMCTHDAHGVGQIFDKVSRQVIYVLGRTLRDSGFSTHMCKRIKVYTNI